MYSLHTHTDYSNASRGFSDSSIKLEDMVKYAKQLGLKGIALTNHEICADFVNAKKLEEKYDFDILLGNEIYLVTPFMDTALRENYDSSTMYYPHFLLIALDEIGNRQIRELSSRAWNRSYIRGIVRTTTLTTDLEEVIGTDRGHVIGTTACLGSMTSRWILDKIRKPHLTEVRERQAEKFIEWCIESVFGKGYFFLEMQPPATEDQSNVNDELLRLSKKLDVDYIITTDAHYLSKDKFNLHKSFLNSTEDGKDREVDDFYRTTYIMSEEEIYEYFSTKWNKEDIALGIANTDKIGSMAKRYKFKKKQVIPKIIYNDNWEHEIDKDFFPQKEYIQKTLNSEHEQDRYLMYLLQKGFKKLIPLEDYEETFVRLEEELTEFWFVSENLGNRLHDYFITIAKLVEIMWSEGDSLVGAGRGSGVSSIIDYILEITQVNPIKMPVDMPFYRFIDRERPELPDIDIDTQSDRRHQIFNAIASYFREFGGTVVNCCTFGTLTTRSAILTACRGLGISNDEAMNISSLVPIERGQIWDFDDVYYGNEEKGRKAVKEFVKLIDSYDGLFNTIKLIEGLVISRGIHASGVFITNDNFNDYGSLMRSPDGTLTSQWDLHDSEEFGLIKYDFLTISALSKIRLTMNYLIEYGHLEQKETLKDTYMEFINPMSLDYDNDTVWESLKGNVVPDLFQFDSIVAMDTVKQIQPSNLIQITQSNSLMRLQKQDDAIESPTQTYVRYKQDISLAYEEMNKYGVPEEHQKVLEKVLLQYYFVADTQEAIMALSRVPELTNFSVSEAHKLRKGIAKKSEKTINETKELFYKKGTENNININTLNYIWEVQMKRQLGLNDSPLC